MTWLFSLLLLLVFIAGPAAIARYYRNAGDASHSAPSFVLLLATAVVPITSAGTLFLLGPAAAFGPSGLVPMALGFLCGSIGLAAFLPAVSGGECRTWNEYLAVRFNVRIARLVLEIKEIGMFACLICVGIAASRHFAHALGMSPAGAIGLSIPLTATACFAPFLFRERARATAYLWFGGTIVCGGFVLLLAALRSVGGGVAGIMEANRSLGHAAAFDLFRSVSDLGTPWILIPATAVVSFATTLGCTSFTRELASSDCKQHRTFAWSVCGTLFCACCGIIAVGSCLAAYFQKDAACVPLHWIANIDASTGRSLTDPATRTRRTSPPRGGLLAEEAGALDPASGRPLLNWNRASDRLTAENAEEIVARGALLHPNSQTPFQDVGELFDESGERLDRTKIAVFRPPSEGRPRAMIEHVRASQEYPAEFANQTLGAMRGFFQIAVAAAFFACACAHSSEAVHHFVTMGLSNRAATILYAVAIALATAVAAMLIDDPLLAACRIFAVLIVPAIGLVPLGASSRRAEGRSAAISFAGGLVTTLSFAVLTSDRLHPAALIPIAFAATILSGWFAALWLGRLRSKREMSGLVLGCGRLGEIRPEEAEIEITIPSSPPVLPSTPTKANWK